MQRKHHIQKLIDHLRLSVAQFEKEIGVGASTINKAIERGSKLGFGTVVKILDKYPTVNKNWIETGEGNMYEVAEGDKHQNEAIPHEETGKIELGNNGLEFVYMTHGQILMGVPHVTPYVYGGYLSGWGDPTFIEEMPKHYIPVSQKHRGRYVAFTMRGESMYDGSERSISPDDILTGREIKKQYWKSRFHTHDYPEFIIHHKEDGLVVKEIIEHNTEEGWIIAHSYNPEYKDYKIFLDDCVEIFNVIEVHKKRGRAKRGY